MGDLVVMPFDPLTKVPLTSEHPNDSLPMELMPNDLDQAWLSDTLGFWPTPLPPTFKKVQK